MVTDCVQRCIANTTGTGLPLEMPTGGVLRRRELPAHDQSIIGRTQQNRIDVPGAVRTTLGNLLLGVSYRYNPTSTLNLSLGVGVTRHTRRVVHDAGTADVLTRELPGT